MKIEWISGKLGKNQRPLIRNPELHHKITGDDWFESVVKNALQYLWDCKGKAGKVKTEGERSFYRNSYLERFLISREVTYSSLDWIFVNYCSGNFILLLEDDSHSTEVIDRISVVMEKYNNSEVIVVNPKSRSKYKFLGVYTIKHEENFSHFYLNGTKIEKQEAIRVLNLKDDEILKFRK